MRSRKVGKAALVALAFCTAVFAGPLATAEDAQRLEGSWVSQVRDVGGNGVFVARGTVAGSRMRPEPEG